LNKKLSSDSRRNKILEIVKTKTFLRLQELANLLNVSEMTIYRDIKNLSNNLFLSKGEVIYKEYSNLSESSYYIRKEKNKELKIAIAKTAINYIKNNDTIFLDGSSTIGYLVNKIIERNFYLTVVTISPIISIELAKKDNIKILCPGGLLEKINFIYNCEIDNFLKSININKAFISCGAFSIEKGFTDLAIGEFKIKRKIVDKIPEINILADHTKINTAYSYTWANYDEVTRLICDNKIKKDCLEKLKAKKIEIILGNVEET